jgi:hypothetical protein
MSARVPAPDLRPPAAAPKGEPVPACPPTRQLSWPTRLLLAQLLALAGAIHLLLTPSTTPSGPPTGSSSPSRRPGSCGSPASWPCGPTRHHGCAGWGSGAASPSPRCGSPPAPSPLPGGQVEPVTLPGVAATALELAALLALAALLPTSPRQSGPGRPRFATGWALLAGAGFAVIFALASGTLVYTPAPLAPTIRVPSLTLADVPLPLGSPLLTWFLTRHLYLLGPLPAFAFLTVAAALLAVSTGMGIGLARAAPHCAPRRGGLAAVAPTLLAVPVCCGAPLAGVLGAGAILPLLRATPWLLAATTVLLAAHITVLSRRWRRWRQATPAVAAGTGLTRQRLHRPRLLPAPPNETARSPF